MSMHETDDCAPMMASKRREAMRELMDDYPDDALRMLVNYSAILAALKIADASMNPPDRDGISLHEWNQRLKAATRTVRSVIAKAEER